MAMFLGERHLGRENMDNVTIYRASSMDTVRSTETSEISGHVTIRLE